MRVFVSHAAQRHLYGKALELPPSRFLSALPELFRHTRLVRPCADESYADEAVLENIGGGRRAFLKKALLPPPNLPHPPQRLLTLSNPFRRLCRIKKRSVLERLFFEKKGKTGAGKCSSLFLGFRERFTGHTHEFFQKCPVFQPLDPEHRLSPFTAFQLAIRHEGFSRFRDLHEQAIVANAAEQFGRRNRTQYSPNIFL